MTASWSTRFSWPTRLFAMGLLAAAIAAWSFPSAYAQRDKEKHPPEDHAREVTSLKQAFGSSQVDLFFEMGELESQKPGLTGVKFVDAVDVTGKELLRFERSGESWLIDPDTVFAYHLHKAK